MRLTLCHTDTPIGPMHSASKSLTLSSRPSICVRSAAWRGRNRAFSCRQLEESRRNSQELKIKNSSLPLSIFSLRGDYRMNGPARNLWCHPRTNEEKNDEIHLFRILR